MSAAVDEFRAIPETWTRRHLLGLEELSADELNCILDAAAAFKTATDGCRRKISVNRASATRWMFSAVLGSRRHVTSVTTVNRHPLRSPEAVNSSRRLWGK